LLDLAILWAELLVRLAPEGERETARQEALTVLSEAEAQCGPSPILEHERRLHTGKGGELVRQPRSAWEHYALGRALLRAGDLPGAAVELESAVRMQPQALWPNFYQGMCAYRLGHNEDAVAAFSVCIGAAPEAAGCFHNRALAWSAMGRADLTLKDYDQALHLDPTFGAAALNRGMLHCDARRYDEALADLQRALKLGVDPAVVHYDLALVNLARGNRAMALTHLGRALEHRPGHKEARKLQQTLQPEG
jgi:tetratricopeptide (TPR) repeat protein